MPFDRPTLTELISRTAQDVATRLKTGTLLRHSFLEILSRALAGAAHTLHGHLEWAARQLLPDTATDEYMDRWASIWGVSRLPATFAEGTATITGEPGSVIPSGTRLKRADGVLYTTLSESVIAAAATKTEVTIQAVIAGSSGNAAAETAITVTHPLVGVDTTAEIVSVQGGVDTENDADMRSRLLLRVRQPPHGGAAHDYVFWAREIPGVTRVWPISDTAGTVTVYIMTDGTDDGFPDTTVIEAVRKYLVEVAPVGAAITVSSPVSQAIDITVLLSPNTAAVQAEVRGGLADLIFRDGAPGGKILLSRIRETVSVSAGESDNAVTVPDGNVTIPDNGVAVLGTVIFDELAP